MDKQITITVANALGEEGLTAACRRGELFRHDSKLEKLYRQGYWISDYAIEDTAESHTAGPYTQVRVMLKK